MVLRPDYFVQIKTGLQFECLIIAQHINVGLHTRTSFSPTTTQKETKLKTIPKYYYITAIETCQEVIFFSMRNKNFTMGINGTSLNSILTSDLLTSSNMGRTNEVNNSISGVYDQRDQ